MYTNVFYVTVFFVSRRNGVLVFCFKFSNVKTESMIRSIFVYKIDFLNG
jgi:hypothetical protein